MQKPLMNEGDKRVEIKLIISSAYAFMLTQWNVNNSSINMRLLIN